MPLVSFSALHAHRMLPLSVSVRFIPFSNIPASYRVLFMQGGGTTQFSAVPLNLCPTPDTRAHYLVTGSWSQAAEQEARRFAATQVLSGIELKETPKGSFTTLPTLDTVKALQEDSNAAFIYACANETVHGVEWGSELEQLFEPEVAAASAASSDAPSSKKPYLVSDMSSSFMSRPVDVSRYGLIYAGAQKNVGPAGLTIVIVRDSLLRAMAAQPSTPLMLQYKLQADKGSMHNTPPCWAIYVTGLVFQNLIQQGGLEAVQEKNQRKAELLYKAIDGSNGFYRSVAKTSLVDAMFAVFSHLTLFLVRLSLCVRVAVLVPSCPAPLALA